ncbi:polyhydroxyalkanoate biosynthesis repressor PhaR [Neobacillus sp. Marseille-QA0830]
MTNEKNYDPLEVYKRISGIWEKQLNGLLYRMTDNRETVRFMKAGLDAHSRYMELLRKNQELMAGFLNIPTKKDVANVAKLSVQAEEKIDLLEEQMWNLQDSLGSLNQENVEMVKEVVTIIQQMKDEFQHAVNQIAETEKIKTELQELKQGLLDIKIIQVHVQEMRKEFDSLKSIKSDLKQLKNNKELTQIQSEIRELKEEAAQLSDIKLELAAMKNSLQGEQVNTVEIDKELALSSAGASKG